MGKKDRKFIGCIIEKDELHLIKALAAYLNLVPHIVVRKAVKRFLKEYENLDELPVEFKMYRLAIKAKYVSEEQELLK